ncbi:hypothetical protein ACTQXV_03770 [Ligilactobacillus salivarius]|uniref:Uncharacterized protein n=1 Tax=Ligilactobacillus salivarius cp400 TaxID=1273133 RepID=V6DJ01_9LACO|nr:hypothetical protein LSCP400_05151 [Ligilactobacillus salivarius cp400]
MEFSQERMCWVEKLLQEKEDTLEYSIARDKLIEMHILPDDPIVKSNDDYWKKLMN